MPDFITPQELDRLLNPPTEPERPQGREELYLSHRAIATKLNRAHADAPNVDSTDHYARGYNGWRDGLDPEAVAHLRGFRAGLDHALRILMASGGATIAGLTHSEIDDEVELAEEHVIRMAKQFVDNRPLSRRKQAGHVVGFYRAVEKLRAAERQEQAS